MKILFHLVDCIYIEIILILISFNKFNIMLNMTLIKLKILLIINYEYYSMNI